MSLTRRRALYAASLATGFAAAITPRRVFAQTRVPPNTEDADSIAAFENYLRTSPDAKDFNGAVMVARHGEPVFVRAFGLANRELAVANTVDTKFRIGSMTKPFTATSIWMLNEQKKLSVSDRLDRHLSNLPDSWNSLTLHQLLTHTSGLMHSWDLADFAQHSSMPATPTETINRFKNAPLLAKPGATYHYSGLGYFILAAVIESVSGQTYEAFLQNYIFDPLGMKDTGGEHPETLLPGRASGYRRKDGHIENAPMVYLPIMTGAGNLYSTLDDIRRFDRAVHGGMLVSKKTMEAMFTPALPGAPYGAGWEIHHNPQGFLVIGHTGSVNGFISAFFCFVDRQVTTVAMSNIAYTPAPNVAASLGDLAVKSDAA